MSHIKKDRTSVLINFARVFLTVQYFWRYDIFETTRFKITFSNFSCMFLKIIFSNLNCNCSNSSYLRNLQEQVKKAFCYQKLFWPCTVWINCSSDLKIFANSRPSDSNFKSFSRSVEQFFLTIGQNNFDNKIPLLWDLGKLNDIKDCPASSHSFLNGQISK